MVAVNFIISTDLDGTLLDHHNYSWQAAEPALDLCRKASIPVILNTSKTLAEAEVLRDELNLASPIIVENGSALVIPLTLLKGRVPSSSENITVTESGPDLHLIFGAERLAVLAFIEQVRGDNDWQFEGFNDWTVDEIVRHTGLSHQAAQAAAQKCYSEPFLWNDSQENLSQFQHQAERAGFRLMRGGRFYHLQGQTDKAKPLGWLKRNACSVFESVDSNSQPKLICLGDNHNDVAMLNIADFPVCVRSPTADFPLVNSNRDVIYTELEGPEGWNIAVQSILS